MLAIQTYYSLVFFDKSTLLKDCLSTVNFLRLVKFSIPDKSSKKPIVLPPVGSDKSSSLTDSTPDFKIWLSPTVESPSIELYNSANSVETVNASPKLAVRVRFELTFNSFGLSVVPSDQLINAYPEFGVAVTVSVEPESNEPPELSTVPPLAAEISTE